MDYREAAAFLAAHDNYLILTHKRRPYRGEYNVPNHSLYPSG